MQFEDVTQLQFTKKQMQAILIFVTCVCSKKLSSPKQIIKATVIYYIDIFSISF